MKKIEINKYTLKTLQRSDFGFGFGGDSLTTDSSTPV
jgi:hypothetical protein